MTALDRLEAALLAHGCDPKRRGEHLDFKCPVHDDRKASATADQPGDQALVCCHAGSGCANEEIVAAVGLTMADLFDGPRTKDSKPEIVATYDYTDADGRLLYQVVRFSPKDFRQRRPDGHGDWIWNMQGVDRRPYHLPEIIAGVQGDRWIVIPEGEKDVDRLRSLGFVATCNAGGAGKWQASWAPYFTGAKLAILVDNDDAGRAHADQVASSLANVAETVRIINLPDLLEHGDVSDWLDGGGSAEILKEMIYAAPVWEPAPEEPFEVLEEVDGAELLDNVVAALQKYVVFAHDAQAVTIALWVLNTYVFDLWDSTPYLHVRSATKQSGKSRLFEVLVLLVKRPWLAVEATEAVLFRKIENATPTLLLDEIDACFGKDAAMTEGLRAVLNAGHRRGATVSRCVGPQHELQDFAVFCPKAFAGIGATLPDTVVDRAIPIELRRRAFNERQPARFRQVRARAELTPLRDRIATWANAARDKLVGAEPELPDELSDRQQDSWEPLLAIADLAGGEWPELARTAAIALHAGAADQDVGVLLLGHLRELFKPYDAKGHKREEHEALSTEDVLDGLVNRGDDSPWARWWGVDVEHGQTKGPGSQLARKLKPYGIEPKQLWLKGGKTRGYKRSDFDDAWGRYLPSGPSPTVYPPVEDGRTVDRRSKAISGREPSEAKSGSEQGSTVLPSLSENEHGGAVPAPLTGLDGDAQRNETSDTSEPRDDRDPYRCLYCGARVTPAPTSIEHGWATVCHVCSEAGR